MSDIKAIAERHKLDEVGQVFTGEAPQSHRDRGVLLKRIRELEANQRTESYNALHVGITERDKRIRELKEELRKEKLLSKEYKVKTAGLQRQNNLKGECIRELEAKLEAAEQDSEYVRKLEVALVAASLLPEKWRDRKLAELDEGIPLIETMVASIVDTCADELESKLSDKLTTEVQT